MTRNFTNSEIKLVCRKLFVAYIFVIGFMFGNSEYCIAGGYLTSAATQASTSAVFASQTNREIICVTVTAASGGGSCQVTQMQFTMQNTNNADVINAKLFYTSTSSVFATTTQYGSTINNPTGTITFNFTSAAHSNNTYYYWLSFDLTASPTVCNRIDAFVPTNGITITGTGAGTKTPTTPDPSGNRSFEGSGCWSYCTPSFTSSVYSVSGVVFNSITNNTSVIQGGASPSYEDFTNISTSVIPDGTYEIRVTANGAGTANTFFVNVFFDWNNDGDFADAGEEVQLGSYASNESVLSGIVVVPGTAYIGSTRMRVFNKFGSYATPCFSGAGNGQAEDYLINICTVDAGAVTETSKNICPVPGSTTISIAGQSVGASIQWQSSSDNVNFSNVVGGSGATTQTYTTASLGAGTYYFRAKVYGACDAYTGSCTVTVDPVLCNPSGPFTTSFETCDATLNTAVDGGSGTMSVTNNVQPNSGSRHGSITGGSNGSFITASKITFVPGRVYTIRVFAAAKTCASTVKIMKSSTGTNTAMNAAAGSDIILDASSPNVSSAAYLLLSADFTVNVAESKYIGIQIQQSGAGPCGSSATYIDDFLITSTCTQCSNGIQDGDETGVDCGGSKCYSGTPTAGSISPAGPISAVCPSMATATLCLSGSSGFIQWQRSPTGGDPWFDIVGENNTTYNASSSDPMYFRAKVTKEGCSAAVYSNAVSFTVSGFSTKTYNAASGSWSTAANWTPAGVPTSCDDVTIPNTSSVTVTPNADCHNLTVNGTLTINFSSTKYLFVYGDLTNNGTITQSQASSANSQGDCNPCCGISLKGSNTTWGGVNNYPLLTVSVGDNSDVFMVNDATIDFLDVTKTSTVGKLSLGAGNTLKITNAFAQSGSEVHVNTGTLWLALQNSMKIGLTTMFPEYGTVFFDFQGSSALSGPWDKIGGSGFYNLKLRQNAGTSYISTNLIVRNDLTILQGASSIQFLYCSICSPLPSVSPPYTVNVYHDWINQDNDGTPFTMTSDFTVVMKGSDEQDITGNVSTNFTNLTVNNCSSTGVVLLQPANVSGILTMTDGKMYTDATNILSLTSAASSNTGNAGSFVDGPMKKIGNTAYVYPLGDGIVWAPFGIAASTDISNDYTAQYYRSPSPYNTSPVYMNGLHHVSYLEYWTIDRNAGTEYPAVSLYWKPGVDHGLVNLITDPLTTAHWNSGTTKWDDMGGTIGGGSTLSAGYISSTVAFPSYSPVTFGSKTGINPLPVNLINFTAACDQDFVKCSWSTLTEINNDFFVLERSADAMHWEYVATVKGAGNSNELKDYEYFDKLYNADVVYYRLTQHDFDGKETSYNTIAINCKSKANYCDIVLYPNPAHNEINLAISSDEPDNVQVYIYNTMGVCIYTNEISIINETTKVKIDLSRFLTGTYYVKCVFEKHNPSEFKFVHLDK